MKKITKASLNKFLRSCQAQWIEDIQEEWIVGCLESDSRMEYGKEKGWIRSEFKDRRHYYFFTEKGKNEILIPLSQKTCAFSGRIV